MSPGWDRFGRSLAQTLAELTERTVLTVSWAEVPTVYVQFEQSATDLVATTAGADLSGEPEGGHREAEQHLVADGWRASSSGASRRWSLSAKWPMRSADCARLAENAVGVFRVCGVPDASRLEYRAWRYAEPDPVGVTYDEDELDPAEPHLVFAHLGIPDAGAVPVDG